MQETTAMKQQEPFSIMACAESGWQAEVHSFFGDTPTIALKLASQPFLGERRLLYIISGGDLPARIYEYEFKEGTTYSRRLANVDADTARRFVADAEHAMLENRGQSCVGKAIQALPIYQSLQFEQAHEELVHPTATLPRLVTAIAEHQLGNQQSRQFYQVSIVAPC